MEDYLFNTTANINDDQKTKLEAYWGNGSGGFPYILARATKQYPDGPKTFRSSFYACSDIKQIEGTISTCFWQLAYDIEVWDVNKGYNDYDDYEYSVENFKYSPPTNIKFPQPIISPQKKEEERQIQSQKTSTDLDSLKETQVEADLIEKSTPEDQKAKGSTKIFKLILGLGIPVATLIIPQLTKLVKSYLPDPIPDPKDLTCPSPERLNELITYRNRIVNQLNNTGTKLNTIGQSITGLSNFLGTVTGLITAVEITSIATSLAAKFLPALPGAIGSLLNDAQTLIRKVTWDTQGNPKLPKIQTTIGQASLALSIIGSYILTATKLLEQLDILIKHCSEYPDLEELSNDIKNIALAQQKASDTLNETTYNGFIIEIETVPYTPTVNRYRAVGKTSQGITMIQSELSFTSTPQTLINELKFIIDKDNLKAY